MIAWQTAEGLARKGHQVTLVAPDGSKCDHAQIFPTGPAKVHDEKMAYAGYKFRTGTKVKDQDGNEIDEEIIVPPFWPILADHDVIIDHSWAKYPYLLKEEGVLKSPVLGVMHAPVNTMYNRPPPVEKPCIVCISDDQRNHYEALFSPGEARTCRNGIDLDFYKPMGIRRTGRFLFLARFSTIKGPDLAINACKKAGAELDLVGDTSITNEPDYLEQCKRMCDGQKIRMVGPASRGECVWWFSQSHVLLHPNQRFREPLGLAPLESMACGTPVIAWRYGAMKETVKERETGWLISSLNELVECINMVKGENPAETWLWMRNRCREWVGDHFSVQRMIDRYEELCIEALDTGGW
jgi:glycosyltransferase involved in cell wall biosynthesis